MSFGVKPHDVVHSYGHGPMGPYSTKAKFDGAADVLGHQIGRQMPPECACPKSWKENKTCDCPVVKPYVRSAYKDFVKDVVVKGESAKARLVISKRSAEFSKVEYKPSDYEPTKTADQKAEWVQTVKEKKFGGPAGFGTTKLPGRNDVSDMRQTLRYRDALEKEVKHSKKAIEAEVEAMTMAMSGGEAAVGGAGAMGMGSSMMRSTSASPTLRTTAARSLGLSAKLPKATHQYDRTRYVDEFHPKISYAEKYERDYGPHKLASTSIGEGCGDTSIIRSPTHGKHFEIARMADTNHLVASIVSGIRA